MPEPTYEDRIAQLLARTTESDGHHVLDTAINGNGYARTHWGGRQVLAHRLVMAWSYSYDLEELPSHIVTRHAPGCPKHCIEPEHLRAGTQRDNARDAIAEGRIPWAFTNGRCQRGHDLTAPGAIWANGHDGLGHPKRTCAVCARLRQAA